MASINFFFRSTKDYAKLTARLLYSTNGINYQFDSPTEIYTTKEFWSLYRNGKKMREAHLIEKKNEIDTKISELRVLVLNSFSKEHMSNIDREWFKNIVYEYFHPKENSELPTDLLKYFRFYVDGKKTEVKESTFKRYRTVLKLVERYYKDNKISSINLQSVNLDFQRSFEKYCLENNYSTNTIGKSVKVIKSVCKNAFINGLNISHQLESIKIKKEETPDIYLSIDELNIIRNLNLPDPLDAARDWLLISCFSGQRISDFKTFETKNIFERKGVSLIELKQQKTSAPIVIPIHSELKRIINKWEGEFPPKFTDSIYNKHIKDICKIAGIDEIMRGKIKMNIDGVQRGVDGDYPKYMLVTSHIGRKSFATNLYGEYETPLIMSATGHKTEQNFLKYIGKTQAHLSIELGKKF
jgi:integrase